MKGFEHMLAVHSIQWKFLYGQQWEVVNDGRMMNKSLASLSWLKESKKSTIEIPMVEPTRN